jgi:hypothetical protein
MTEFNEKVLIGTITLIIGIAIKHIWDKYINRITRIKYSIWHNYIGSSLEDVKFGSVKLLYNNTELKNLYASNVILKNETGKDVNDLELNISCNNGSLILVSHGRNSNSIKELEFTSNYREIIDRNIPDDATYIYTRRDYKIPVINRGDVIEITLLTTNLNNERPLLFVTSEHKGVKLKFYIEPIKLLGVPQNTSVFTGMAASLILCIPIFYYVKYIPLLIVLSLLNGWIASLYGVVILRIFKWLKRLFE